MRNVVLLFKICIISAFLCGYAFICAETFRVHATIPVNCTDITTEVKLTAGINDALIISIPEDTSYVSGIELTFKIPEIIATWRDTIAYSLYDNITPQPNEKTVDYEGTRISVATFPGKFSHTLYIPLSEDMEIKASPYYEKIAVIPDTKNNSIFFRMQLAMKGVPEDFENAQFEITAKPVLINKGKLALFISEPTEEHKHYEIFIDEKPFDIQKSTPLLAVGEHHLAITSEAYRNEIRTFRIEQAKTTPLSVAMRGTEPTIKLITPENAQIFFDGEKIANRRDEITVTPGNHTVRFIIGDYEVVRTVNAVNGHSYTINLSVDATVTEDDGEIISN